MTFRQEQREPHHRVVADLVERLGGVPVSEVPRPTVGSPRGISPRGSHRTERDCLPSLRSSHPLRRYARIQAQWAKSSGSLSVTPRHHALNRFQLRSRTYFFRAHRIT
jgi:hypothetical protein